MHWSGGDKNTITDGGSIDSIAISVFVLLFTCIYLSLTNTIRNKNQRNTDLKTSWLVYITPPTTHGLTHRQG